jgi:hypothetical protein
MIIIGAGVIGVELGSVWSRLGAEVRLELELLIIFELFDYFRTFTYLSSNFRFGRVSKIQLCFNF